MYAYIEYKTIFISTDVDMCIDIQIHKYILRFRYLYSCLSIKSPSHSFLSFSILTTFF